MCTASFALGSQAAGLSFELRSGTSQARLGQDSAEQVFVLVPEISSAGSRV